jgi:hypothetical protein
MRKVLNEGRQMNMANVIELHFREFALPISNSTPP